MKNQKANRFVVINAVGLILLIVYNVIRKIEETIEYKYYTISFITIIYSVIAIALVVMLLLRKKKLGLVRVAGANVLLTLYYIINYISLFNILGCLVAISTFALILINCIPSLKGKAKLTKILWIIPGALMLVNHFIKWLSGSYFIYLSPKLMSLDYFSYFSQTWIYFVINLVEVAAFALLGWWLKENFEDVTNIDNSENNEYATYNPQSITHNQATLSVIGGADKLKMYKDLLDSGTITQEEFDAKKKQILEL